MSGQDGAAAADAAPASAVPEALPCAPSNDLPEAAGLTVKIAKAAAASDPTSVAAASAATESSRSSTDAAHGNVPDGAAAAAQPDAPSGRSTQQASVSSTRRELLHSKSAKAVLTIGAYVPDPAMSPGASTSSPHGESPEVPPQAAAAEHEPSSTSPPLLVPPVASSLGYSSASGDYSGGMLLPHQSPRTSGPGQQPRQPRTSSSTYTPFMVKAPRHTNIVDGLNQPPSPLMGSPVGTPTAMMFPQTPFAQHHPHFASPYGQGRYPSNPFAPDHPMSPQTSGPYGYFHPFFNNIQPFSPSMLAQHGSGNIMHMGGQLSRSNSIVAGQFGKPPAPPGVQPPSARASRKSTSSSGDHAFSRLSESSGIGPQGSHQQGAGQGHHNGPSPPTSAPGNAPASVDPPPNMGGLTGSGSGGYINMAPSGPMPHFSAPGSAPHYLSQHHHLLPLHPQRSNPGMQLPWATSAPIAEGDTEAQSAAVDNAVATAAAAAAAAAASNASAPMAGMVGGFAFPQDGMAMYPWLGMPVPGMGGLGPGQMTVMQAPYYMLMMTGQQQSGAAPHLGSMAMPGMQGVSMAMSGLQPPPPPPKAFPSPGDAANGSMAAAAAAAAAAAMVAPSSGGAFEFPDLSAASALPMMGHAAMSGLPQMYGSVPIDLRTGRMFVPPPPHAGIGSSPAGARGGIGGAVAAAAAGAGMAGGMPPRAPRRRNATELKVGPDGQPRLNARQRRTLRRAKERAIKGLMEAGHVLLQKHGHLAAAGADTDSSTGDTGAESGSEGSEDGEATSKAPKSRTSKSASPGGTPSDSPPQVHATPAPGSGLGDQELFPGSSRVSDTTELYLGAAISVASGSAGPKAAAAAAEALSKAAADLEDMDISHLISHLTRKEGSVDEKLIRDLQIIQNLIGTLKVQHSQGQAPPQGRQSQGGYAPAPSAASAYAPGSSAGMPVAGVPGLKGQRPPPLQVGGASTPAGPRSSSLRASPSPSPGPLAALDGPGAPKPQTVAAAAAAIGLLPPELQGLGQQMRAIIEGKQAVHAVPSGAVQQPPHDMSNGTGPVPGAGLLVQGSAATAAATERILASLAPVATSTAAPGALQGMALQPVVLMGGAGALQLKESSLQSKVVGAGSPDGANDAGAAKIAAVH